MKRLQEIEILENIKTSKIVLVSGPRLSGKEELIEKIIANINIDILTIHANDKTQRNKIEQATETQLIERLSNYSLVIIHEAQYLKNLQQIIELILSDGIASGMLLNCSFQPMIDELLLEVLDAQGLHIRIYPPTFYELASHFGLPQENALLEKRLVYGNYPQVVLATQSAQEILLDILDTIWITDLSAQSKIYKKEQLISVLQHLAFMIGQPISYNEIAQRSQLDNETVERYIILLEKAYVLIRISAFHNDKRYELKKNQYVYFVDTGMRNMLINNFNPPTLRTDMDALWKNWLISERIKWNSINHKQAKYSFWRTHTKQTIDFIEESLDKTGREQKIAYKCTWEKKKKIKFPKMFSEYYPTIRTQTLNKTTYWAFLSKK